MVRGKKVQLRTCRICGKAFVGSSDPHAKNICKNCKPKADRALQKLRDYLVKHPKKMVTIEDLAFQVGESVKVVQALYEDESIVRETDKKPPKKPLPPKKTGHSRKDFSKRYRRRDSKE